MALIGNQALALFAQPVVPFLQAFVSPDYSELWGAFKGHLLVEVFVAFEDRGAIRAAFEQGVQRLGEDQGHGAANSTVVGVQFSGFEHTALVRVGGRHHINYLCLLLGPLFNNTNHHGPRLNVF